MHLARQERRLSLRERRLSCLLSQESGFPYGKSGLLKGMRSRSLTVAYRSLILRQQSHGRLDPNLVIGHHPTAEQWCHGAGVRRSGPAVDGGSKRRHCRKRAPFGSGWISRLGTVCVQDIQADCTARHSGIEDVPAWDGVRARHLQGTVAAGKPAGFLPKVPRKS